MADAVTARSIGETPTHLILHLTNISDATGETAVIKADKSTYLASDGAEPASLDIERVQWNIQGFTNVRLLWGHTTDDVALVLNGVGAIDFSSKGLDVVPANALLKDPRSAGGAGDILLTTIGAGATTTYDITLWLRKQPD